MKPLNAFFQKILKLAWVYWPLTAALLALFVFLAWRFDWHWTGFFRLESITIVIETVESDPATSKTTRVTRTTNTRPGKTLWDLLGLAIIPAVLAGGAYWLNKQQREAEVKAEDKRAQTERDIANDRERKDTLQLYLDKMTELLLEKNLRNAQKEAEVWAVARARTVTALRELDGTRKGTLVRFLYEAGLSDRAYEKMIDLQGADLSQLDLLAAALPRINLRRGNLRQAGLRQANLQGADLGQADLRGADLSGADLRGSDLHQAVLQGADLEGADLEGADLEGADLFEAELRMANLDQANLNEARLIGARYDNFTHWPLGFDPQVAGIEKPETGIPPALAQVFVEQEAINSLSGFVASERGYLITGPIRAGVQQIWVRLWDRDRKLPATIVKRSPDQLLTLLQLPEGSYPYLEFALANLGDIVFRVNSQSGVVRGRVKGVQGMLKISAPFEGDREIIVLGVEVVEPVLTQAGEGAPGSAVLNRHRESVGVLFARSPGGSYMISSRRIGKDFPVIARNEPDKPIQESKWSSPPAETNEAA